MHSVCCFSTKVRIFNQIQRVKWIQGNHSNFHLKKEAIKPLYYSWSRIICTDSQLQEGLDRGEHIKGTDGETLCFPVMLMKENYKTVDHYYLKQVSIANEIQNIEDLVRTTEFKNVLARSSFFYDVNLTINSQNSLPSSSIYYYSFEDIYNSSVSCLKNKQTRNEVEEVFTGSSSSVNDNNNGKPSEAQLLVVIDRLTHTLLNFFEKPHDYSIYHRNIIFQNNIKGVVVKGLPAYSQAMYVLKIYGFLQYAKVKVEILKMTHHIEDGTVRVRWRVRGISRSKVLLNFWKLRSTSWQDFIHDEADWLDGFSVFSVGPDGLIYKHMCDKMTPNDNAAGLKKTDLKSRLFGLLEWTPRNPAAGSLNTVFPCYRNQELYCKKMT